MSDTITITIPVPWIDDLDLDEDDLRQALQLGLAQLRQQQAVKHSHAQIIQALRSTGRIRHLTGASEADSPTERQKPPTLPDPPVSEILIAQRSER